MEDAPDADKGRERERMEAFGCAAGRAFMGKHPSDGRFTEFYDIPDERYGAVKYGKGEYLDDIPNRTYYFYRSCPDTVDYAGNTPTGEFEEFYDVPKEKGITPLMYDRHPEFKDAADYYWGRSKYTPGKGWNESLVRAVTEAVIRRLKRK